MAVDLALTPDRYWAVSAAELAAEVAAAGFTALGIAADDAGSDGSAAYAATGLRCHEVHALLFTDDLPATMAAAQRLAAQAEAMRAACVLTVFTTPLSLEVESGVRHCAEMFADGGAGMAVEFSPLGPISSIAEGMEVVRAAHQGAGRAG